MEKSIYETLGGSYTTVGDTRLPDLIVGESGPVAIGKYGRMRRRHLKEHRPVLYTNLLTTGKLDRHLAEIDKACEEQMELLIKQMAQRVRRMNSIRDRAEEIVVSEVVYCGRDTGC